MGATLPGRARHHEGKKFVHVISCVGVPPHAVGIPPTRGGAAFFLAQKMIEAPAISSRYHT
jgi:hypothetical protein